MSRWDMPRKLFQRELGRPSPSYWTKTTSFIDELTNNIQNLHCFDGQSQLINKESTYEYSIPIYSLSKIPNDPGLVVTDESGQVHIVRNWFDSSLPNLDKRPCFITSINVRNGTAIPTAKCIAGKLMVGTGAGDLCVLDLETKSLLRHFHSHEKCIKKVESVDGDVIVSCGKDNVINIHDLRVKAEEPVNVIHEAHSLQSPDVSTANRIGRSKYSKLKGSRTGLSNCITDVIFVDDNHLISCGLSDGRLKLWDLRVTYKHMKKWHAVTVVEYPGSSNIKGFSCLQQSGSRIYASSVNYEIYQFGLGDLSHEATYKSPSKISNYSKIDVSQDGNYLAVGSNENKVHIFKTVSSLSKDKVNFESPIKTLEHKDIVETAVCCPIFSSFSNIMITTGGDSNLLTKWIPFNYLTSSPDLEKLRKKEDLESPIAIQELKTEFKMLSKRNFHLHYNGNQENNKANAKISPLGRSAKRVCFAKLDSFPNYVLDGMKLPHVVPRIRIKLRSTVNTAAKNWLMSPSTRISSSTKPFSPTNVAVDQETTPKRRSTALSRKRKKFCDESLSPKIIQFFKTASPAQ